MKKLLAITTLCAAALCSGTFISAAAEADDGITVPDSFTVDFYSVLTGVNDFAVGDNQYAFADANKLYIYTVTSSNISNGNVFYNGAMKVYTHDSDIQTLEYSDGNLYFSDGTTYLYSDGGAVSDNFTFTEYNDGDLITEGSYAYNIKDDKLVIYNANISMSTTYTSGNYSHLKKIDGTIYFIKNTSLCSVTGETISTMYFSYENYNNVDGIATNGTAQALSGERQPQTAVIPAGACIIRVDEDYLGEDVFTVWDDSVIFTDEQMTVQVLYMPDGGNAALVAAGTKTYLTLKTNLTTADYAPEAVTAESYYLLDSASIYAIPYENEYTKITEIEKDAVVTVTGYVSGEVFDYDYYKVEYAADGETISGYVVAKLLTEYTFDNDIYEKETINDGDQSNENNAGTLVLVMVIVVLVLIAAGYLAFVATSGKKKRKKK